MSLPAAVVVNAAGLGSRLGLDRPKALLEVAGRPLIHWQLTMLADVEDVRVVAGYDAQEVVAAVFAERPDATIVFNHDYRSTGTASSLMRGARHLDGPVLSLDCDLVVHPDDLRAFLDTPAPLLGVVPVQSEEPVSVAVAGRDGSLTALGFGAEQPGTETLEWSGLTSFDPGHPDLGPDDRHVFELIRPLLPMPAVRIRAVEVDYPSEIATMERWIERLREDGAL